jgi:8-oxo-dGTP pyrophosphatase MutT (NUDIX family)
MSDTKTQSASIEQLHTTLGWLKNNPCPYVAGPESTKKRASVALIIRIQPSYAHQPDKAAVPAGSIDSFFAQEWVKHGQAEVLFIKRAARKGDRWTSHVALPGGRRDPDDQDDQHAAIREAVEEVGIDLSERNCIAVGNLPQRIVTTSWGRVPLMVLCPYVFLVTNHHLPPLRLQPTEVASTHWVPVRSLLDPSQRTVHTEDVSNRLAKQERGLKKLVLGVMLGEMEFSAIQLLPTESLYCHESPIDDTNRNNIGLPRKIMENLITIIDPPLQPPPPQQQPLILWGLTLGVVADFLDLLPPHNALELWTYPTFTMPDIRAVIWLTTYNFRKSKRLQLESEIYSGPPTAAVGEEPNAVSIPDNERREQSNEVGMEGLSSRGSLRGHSFESAVGTMLDGYYTCMRRGVTYALGFRVLSIASIVALLWFKRPSPAALARAGRHG